ncbi:unnamed protein product [Schistosoma mattheei]|uniref:Uncharacterized protein n=1 Tax=Schistosoma mattheei TaxID=31246 RepID=A0A183NUG1_9TREM|nr:unnamed protein product [Schistosoma mattheei]
MEPVMESLDIHSDLNAFEDYFERFEIWVMANEDDEDVNIVAHFLGKEAYSLLKTLALPGKPISLPYTTLKELLPDYVKYTNFECGDSKHPYDLNRSQIHGPLNILNKFEETISQESNLDVLSNIIRSHNAFVSCGKLVQCEAQILNELDFDYNSDDFMSTAVYPYHEVTSNVYSSQCKKYVLNEATSSITCGYKDPTLFRGGG